MAPRKKMNITSAMPTSLNGQYIIDALDPLPYTVLVRHRMDAKCRVLTKKRGKTELDAKDCTMHNALLDIPGVVDADVRRSVAFVRFNPAELILPLRGQYWDFNRRVLRPKAYTNPLWWMRYDLDEEARAMAAELDDLYSTSPRSAQRVVKGLSKLPPTDEWGKGALLPPRKPSGIRSGSTAAQRGTPGSGTERKRLSVRRGFVNS